MGFSKIKLIAGIFITANFIFGSYNDVLADPPPATNFKATRLSNTQVRLTWDYPSNVSIDEFRIWRRKASEPNSWKGPNSARPRPNERSYIDNGVAYGEPAEPPLPNIGWVYRIAAFKDGEGNSDPLDAGIDADPPPQGPDLTLRFERDLHSTELKAGDEFNITCNVLNIGTQTTGTSYEVSVYLSTNNAFDSNDVKIGTDTRPALGSNNEHSRDIEVVIPARPSGSVYLLLVVDPLNRITETNEDNNTVFKAVTVGGSGISLSNYSYDTSVSPGDSLHLEYEITNSELQSIRVTLGASLMDAEGRTIEDTQNDDIHEVPAGKHTYKRVLRVPIDVTPGPADLRMSLWIGDKGQVLFLVEIGRAQSAESG